MTSAYVLCDDVNLLVNDATDAFVFLNCIDPEDVGSKVFSKLM
jgi:hypothetical protein